MKPATKLFLSAILGILLLPVTILVAILYGILSGIMNPIKTRSDS